MRTDVRHYFRRIALFPFRRLRTKQGDRVHPFSSLCYHFYRERESKCQQIGWGELLHDCRYQKNPKKNRPSLDPRTCHENKKEKREVRPVLGICDHWVITSEYRGILLCKKNENTLWILGTFWSNLSSLLFFGHLRSLFMVLITT